MRPIPLCLTSTRPSLPPRQAHPETRPWQGRRGKAGASGTTGHIPGWPAPHHSARKQYRGPGDRRSLSPLATLHKKTQEAGKRPKLKTPAQDAAKPHSGHGRQPPHPLPASRHYRPRRPRPCGQQSTLPAWYLMEENHLYVGFK
ncbi:hypothetical protein E2C01_061273 [Portunus trituberculatus]|uniref:Uncharacterized protein n=1 Tax=Portunus trituberculatus TaxID=210409 RepID=A0A5B7HCQ3_PORTR|nr:hypothetical protein [Portunus trituberculatus]